MGNKIGRRREVVDEKYTRPQGLYHHKDVDHKKLRKLILDSKLAPCYPGDDECAVDLEECPICFLYYPSLNRSRCCTKGICTECFLQMKPPNSSRPTQCPFCKTSNYAVEYRGVKTKEEKGMEQLEEQRVIEAQIRMRQQELHDDEDRTQKGQEMTSSSRIVALGEAEYRDISSNPYSAPSFRRSKQGNESVSSQALYSMSASRRSSHLRQNREDNCDLDLEEIMVMEAIWLSIQGQGALRNPACGSSGLPGPSSSEYHYDSQQLAPAEASPSAGLAFTVAALAEHQHMSRDPANVASTSAPAFNMVQQSGSILSGGERVVGSYHPESWIEVSPPDSGRAVRREEGEWAADYGSEVAEAGTSYTSSDNAMDAGAAAALLPEGASMAAGHLLPDSFEEQMMLAMTVSLAEARARTGGQGVTWL